jgi:archaellum component FlaG (FlaF/FlaG flagellin family)
MLTDSVEIQCPYCGETIDVIVDGSLEQQSYIEDCSVCCRPIELSVTVMEDEVRVNAKRDDE